MEAVFATEKEGTAIKGGRVQDNPTTMVDLATLYYHPNQHSENTLVLLFGID